MEIFPVKAALIAAIAPAPNVTIRQQAGGDPKKYLAVARPALKLLSVQVFRRFFLPAGPYPDCHLE